MNQVTVEVNSKIQGHAGAFEVLRDSYEAVRGCTAAIETGHQQTLPLIVFF